MKERGVVVETSMDTAKVRLNQKPECIKCGLCSSAGGGFQTLTVHSKKPLQINQIVTIEINQKFLTISSLLLYGVPLLGFITGAIVGYIIGKEILAVIFAIGFLVIDLLAIKIIIKRTHLTERIGSIIDDK